MAKISSSPPPHFLELESLRGLLAICVVLFHIIGISCNYQYDLLPTIFIFKSGDQAVNAFFILSGFVMAYAYSRRIRQRQLTFSSFGWRRLWRLYPLLFCWTILYTLIRTLHHGLAYLHTITPGTIWSELLFLQGAFPPGSSHLLVNVSWSASVEFWVSLFYFFIIVKQKAHFANAFIVTLIFIHSVLPIFPFIDLFTSASGILRGMMGIGLGLIIYQAWSKWRHSPAVKNNLPQLKLIFYGFLLIGGYFLATQMPFSPSYFSIIAALVFLLAALLNGQCRWLTHKPLLYLGKISYSLYLCHIIIAGTVVNLTPHFPWPIPIFLVNCLLTLGLSLLCAHFSYRYLELSFPKLKSRLSLLVK